MTLKERFNACETAFGNALMKVAAVLGIAVAAIGEGGQWVGLIPEGFIPVWVKTWVGVILFAAMIWGKMTAKPKE